MSVETIIQPKDKFLLTVEEASDYFGIGQKKLRQIIVNNLDAGIIIQNGVKYLIKRQRFEEYLNELTAI
jgi:excisionase family DNA binding protein